jgi:hypothetical protein
VRDHEVEEWALRLVQQVKAGDSIEDGRVELKADWPTDPYKAARRIAGLANAARSPLVLLVIGLDEKRGVVGAGSTDLATWWPGVKKHFHELAPSLHDLVVHADGLTVRALLFGGERVPYVVRNPDYGKTAGVTELEVPWREGTSVRSARRSDLIQVLSPLRRSPKFEVLLGDVEVQESGNNDEWKASVRCYLEAPDGERVVIPHYRCSGQLAAPDGQWTLPLEMLRFRPVTVAARVHDELPTLRQGAAQLIVDGPGLVTFEGQAVSKFDAFPHGVAETVLLQAQVGWVGGEVPVPIEVELLHTARNDEGVKSTWVYRQLPGSRA